VTVPARTSAPARGRDSAPARGRDSGPQRGRSPAVARAYARRAQRIRIHRSGPGRGDAGRVPFVMLVMALLGAALVATLWLSTAATANSYQLQSMRKDARDLSERSESLSRQVATLETAPELARRARELGMVPAGDAAQLVVRPDGGVVLIGQPRRAVAPAPRPVAPVPAAPATLPVAPPAAVPPAAVPGAVAIPNAAAPVSPVSTPMDQP
jgi:cell division protein FtsB